MIVLSASACVGILPVVVIKVKCGKKRPFKTVSDMFSAYRMVQPGATMYVPTAAANGAAAAAAAAAANAQQSIVYTTLPQYQTQ